MQDCQVIQLSGMFFVFIGLITSCWGFATGNIAAGITGIALVALFSIGMFFAIRWAANRECMSVFMETLDEVVELCEKRGAQIDYHDDTKLVYVLW